jgi:phage antirepressor YoqD-like protein
MNEAAKILGLGFGRNILFRILREKGILDSENTPYQRYVDEEYFKLIIKPRKAQRWCDKVTLVTDKGLEFLLRLFANDNDSSATTQNNDTHE